MELATDIEAPQGLAAGCPEALAGLFREHQGGLLGFFLRLTGQRSLGEDLVQEVFLRILRYRHTYDARQPFKPWMFRIARRVHLDHLARQRPHVPLEDLLEEPAAGFPCPLAGLAEREDLARLEAALARLPLRKRELLLLSREPGLTHQDLAALLGGTPGAIKVQVHRALKDLRGLFLEEAP